MQVANKLTKRDVEILKFINEFGFCELRHLQKWFSLNQSNCYKIMKRLCKHNFIIHDRIFLRRPGVYRLSKEGAVFTDLPRLKKLPLTKYDHQLKIIDVYMKLSNQHPSAYWISERRLLKDQTPDDILKRKHIADGLLVIDKKQIAIEVELSLKSKRRLGQIFKGYAAQFAIEEVWYFCSPNLIHTLKKISENRTFIHTYNLTEFLHE